jgi:hypothetical protein
MTLHQKLDHPIAIPEGGCVRTIGDALNFYFALPARERIEWHWTETAKLFLLALEENDDAFLARAENQFRLALGRRSPQGLLAAA